ncbi:MAG: aldo/keto reductase [Lactobacillus sp.]|nr:MAG: aldo/keto reductase [Lactobacillus sp.]
MTTRVLKPSIRLNNQIMMPQLGLGVWKASNQDAEEAVRLAIKNGYVMIDTAKQYGNEAGVGNGIVRGLKETQQTRDDVFITTKVFSGDQGYDQTLAAINGQLERLQTDHVDLLLMHWPVNDLYNETWQAMESIYRQGKALAIGVCNFDVERLTDLLRHASITPAVNQIEFNPRIHQQAVVDLCRVQGIQVEAWSPLGNGQSISNPLIGKIATAHQKTAAQIILRWETQQGLIVIPKSVHESRMIENAAIDDFDLTADEMAQISSLNTEEHSRWYDNYQWYGNPDGDPNFIMQA